MILKRKVRHREVKYLPWVTQHMPRSVTWSQSLASEPTLVSCGDGASDTGWDQTQGLEPQELGLIYGDESSGKFFEQQRKRIDIIVLENLSGQL